MLSLLDLALSYTKAGISIIPVSPRQRSALESSNDTVFDCSGFIQQRIPTEEELRRWFKGGTQVDLAVVLGRISGGLECLDLLYTAVVKLFHELVSFQGGASLLERVPAVREPVQGRTRLFYRCRNPVRSFTRTAVFELPSEPGVALLQLLACVHGEHCWTALAGSNTSGDEPYKGYSWVGPDLIEVPTISEDERQLLLESAGCLNAWVDPNAILAAPSLDGFANQVTWDQILVPLGWKKVRDCGDVSLWHSPERTKPGYCAVSGIGIDRDLLYMVQTRRAYTKFGAFAAFYFGGDFERAKSVRLRSAPPSRRETLKGGYYLGAVGQAQPLVSCMMPTTGDRRRFLPQAIKCFQRQTYPNSELVILCDGEDDLSDLIPRDDKRLHYFYLGRNRHTLGAKLNLGCERATGDLIAHFDDDDWSHPERLSFQVGALLAEGAEICRLSQLSFFEIGTGVAWLCRPPALLHPSLWPGLPAGGTFLYRRSYWSTSPFPDISLGADLAFITAEGRQDHSVLVSDYRLYVVMIHSLNTCDYSERLSYWSPWPGDIREIMGSDLDFYRSLKKTETLLPSDC